MRPCNKTQGSAESYGVTNLSSIKWNDSKWQVSNVGLWWGEVGKYFNLTNIPELQNQRYM